MGCHRRNNILLSVQGPKADACAAYLRLIGALGSTLAAAAAPPAAAAMYDVSTRHQDPDAL